MKSATPSALSCCSLCGANPQIKQTDISLLVIFCPTPACESVAVLAVNHKVLERLWNARNRPGRALGSDVVVRVAGVEKRATARIDFTDHPSGVEEPHGTSLHRLRDSFSCEDSASQLRTPRHDDPMLGVAGMQNAIRIRKIQPIRRPGTSPPCSMGDEARPNSSRA